VLLRVVCLRVRVHVCVLLRVLHALPHAYLPLSLDAHAQGRQCDATNLLPVGIFGLWIAFLVQVSQGPLDCLRYARQVRGETGAPRMRRAEANFRQRVRQKF
jgi:hypothetical protein